MSSSRHKERLLQAIIIVVVFIIAIFPRVPKAGKNNEKKDVGSPFLK